MIGQCDFYRHFILWHNYMPMNAYNSTAPDLFNELKQKLGHNSQANLVRNDLVTKLLYSTDASIYQVEPLGVVFPRHIDELQAIMETCIRYQTPVLARGSGSSLAGQAIGPGLIIDCSRYLNRLVEIDSDANTAIVEPGLILSNLNKLVAKHGLQFGPDPASAERASMGGSIANNATGAHSIRYGMTADHLISADVVLSDGSITTLEDVSLDRASQLAQGGSSPDRLTGWYRAALDIRQNYSNNIQEHWPRTWRCASGYTVNYLLPWTASQPPWWNESGLSLPEGYEALPYPPLLPDRINVAKLLAGSEGTLAIIRQAKINLTPLQPHTMLAVMDYPSIADACDDVPALLEYNPSAIELIPASLVVLARSLPAYAHQLKVLDPLTSEDRMVEGGAYLVVEFTGPDQHALNAQVLKVGRNALIVQDANSQKQVWAVRKVGLGILQSRPGDMKPWAFIEDLSVPVDRLGEFIREMERILADQGTRGEIYAHASAGCLHVRPIINLKTLQGCAGSAQHRSAGGRSGLTVGRCSHR